MEGREANGSECVTDHLSVAHLVASLGCDEEPGVGSPGRRTKVDELARVKRRSGEGARSCEVGKKRARIAVKNPGQKVC